MSISKDEKLGILKGILLTCALIFTGVVILGWVAVGMPSVEREVFSCVFLHLAALVCWSGFWTLKW